MACAFGLQTRLGLLLKVFPSQAACSLGIRQSLYSRKDFACLQKINIESRRQTKIFKRNRIIMKVSWLSNIRLEQRNNISFHNGIHIQYANGTTVWTIPSNNSKLAPPPVLTWLTLSTAPNCSTQVAVSPPPVWN